MTNARAALIGRKGNEIVFSGNLSTRPRPPVSSYTLKVYCLDLTIPGRVLAQLVQTTPDRSEFVRWVQALCAEIVQRHDVNELTQMWAAELALDPQQLFSRSWREGWGIRRFGDAYTSLVSL